MADIGERIKNGRINKRLTQAELAERVGCSITYLSNIENGKIPNPGVLLFSKIADQLDLTVEELIGEHRTKNGEY